MKFKKALSVSLIFLFLFSFISVFTNLNFYSLPTAKAATYSTITRVQNATGQANSYYNAATLTSTPTLGNILIAVVTITRYGDPGYVQSLIDGNSKTTWIKILNASVTGTYSSTVEFWYASVPSGTSASIYTNYAPNGASKTFVYEYSGLSLSNLVDKNATYSLVGTTATVTTGNTTTTTLDNELLLGGISAAAASGNFETPTAGFDMLGGVYYNYNIGAAFEKIVSAQGEYYCNATNTDTLDNYSGAIVTFKAALVSADITPSISGVGSGSISPSGVTTVDAGDDQQFTFTATSPSLIGNISVDSVIVGTGLTNYNFTNVQADHTIDVQFYLPPAGANNVTFSGTAGILDFEGGSQRHNFYADGYYWTFATKYVGFNYVGVYYSSIDGINWSYTQNITTGINPNNFCGFNGLAVAYNGSQFQFAVSDFYSTGEASHMLYRTAIPSGGSLSFTSSWQTIATSTYNSSLGEYLEFESPNIFLDAQNQPWVSWESHYFGYTGTEYVDHSIYSNGTWVSQGGIFPYVIGSSYIHNALVGIASMVAYSDNTVQWFFASADVQSGVLGNFVSFLFDSTSLVSSFDTGIRSQIYAYEYSLLLTPNNKVFFVGSIWTNSYTPRGQCFIEFSKTATVNITSFSTSPYSGQIGYDATTNRVIILASPELYSRDICMYLADATSGILDTTPIALLPNSLPPTTTVFGSTGGADECMEAAKLSLIPSPTNDYLLTYLADDRNSGTYKSYLLNIATNNSALPPPIGLYPSTLSVTPFWSYLLNGNFIGFFTSIFLWSFIQYDILVGALLALIFVPLYIRTKSLMLMSVLWIIIGGFFIASIPSLAALALIMLVMGISSIFWKLVHPN